MRESLLQKYKDEPIGFSDDNVPVAEKNTKEWNLRNAQALWSMHACGNTVQAITANDAKSGNNKWDYPTLDSYGEGTQDPEKYKQRILGKNPNNEDARKAYVNISWDNQSVLPRYEDSVLSLIRKSEPNIQPRGVDMTSFSERDRMKFWIKERQSNPFYNRMNERMGGEFVPSLPFQPADQQEIEMAESTTMELNHEISIKEAQELVLNHSEWDEVSFLVRRELFRKGITVCRVEFDHRTRKPRVTNIPADRALFPKSNRRDYDDADTFGHWDYMSIGRIKEMAGLETEDFARFAEDLKNNYGQDVTRAQRADDGTVDSHGGLNNDATVLVLFGERRSWNTEVRETTKFGSIYHTDLKMEGEKISKSRYEMWYKFCWVVGTDVMLQFGPVEHVYRNRKGRCKSSYIVQKVRNRSIVASAIPIIDEMEIASKKFQIGWAQAAPPGFVVNFRALQGITWDNQTISPFDVLQIYLQTGRLVVDVDMTDRRKATSFLVQDLPGGLKNLIADATATYNMHIEKLNSITGVTEPVLGTAPRPGQLNGVTEMAQEGATNRLENLFDAFGNVKKNIVDRIVRMIQSISMIEGEYEDMFYEMSQLRQHMIKLPARIAHYNY